MRNDNKNSLIAGSIMGGLVGLHRFVSQEKLDIILSASTLQGIQTYIIARVCIVIYGKSTEIISSICSEKVAKIITGGSIGLSSGGINYILQAERGGSLTESIVMTTLSSLGIIAHEYKITEKLFPQLSSTKY